MGYTDSVVFTWVIYILEFVLILWRIFTKNEKKKKTPVILLVLLMFISAGACISTRGGVLYAWQNTIPFLADPSGPEPFGPIVVMTYVLALPLTLLPVGMLVYGVLRVICGFVDGLLVLLGKKKLPPVEFPPKKQKDPPLATTIWTREGPQTLFHEVGAHYSYRDRDGVEHRLTKSITGILWDDNTGTGYQELGDGDWM